ncbi:hypothetical protein [Nitrosopumilus sp.]|nr:hypothetical protein [Nitrosopumilus sp.]
MIYLYRIAKYKAITAVATAAETPNPKIILLPSTFIEINMQK